jgi:hypothetical protein
MSKIDRFNSEHNEFQNGAGSEMDPALTAENSTPLTEDSVSPTEDADQQAKVEKKEKRKRIAALLAACALVGVVSGAGGALLVGRHGGNGPRHEVVRQDDRVRPEKSMQKDENRRPDWMDGESQRPERQEGQEQENARPSDKQKGDRSDENRPETKPETDGSTQTEGVDGAAQATAKANKAKV